METADTLLTTIKGLLDLGIPVAILIVIAWLALKYTPGLIKAANNLGDSMKSNTTATNDLRSVFNVQGDQLRTVTEKLQGAVDSLARCEAKQVTMPDFVKLFDLVSSMQVRLNELQTEMNAHNEYVRKNVQKEQL